MITTLAALDINGLLWVLVPLGTLIALILGVGVLAKKFYRKVPQGEALIINKTNGVVVTFVGGFVWPVIHRAETMDISVQTLSLSRKGKNGLICKDNIRADIEVKFYIRVNKSPEDVLKVASSVGCERASDHTKLDELFSAKFSEGLKTAGKQMDFESLFTDREHLKTELVKIIGQDLNGYKLEDVAIDYLEQTPISELDRLNVQDSQGIRKITERTSVEHIATNESNRSREMSIKKRDVEATQAMLELDKQQQEAQQRQIREIEITRAKEEATTKLVQAEERLRAETALIKTEEQLQISTQNKDREIEVASKNRERTIAVEAERVTRDRDLEVVAREELVGMKTIAKEQALETSRKSVEEARRERIIVQKAATVEEEKAKDIVAEATAARVKNITLTKAEENAQAHIIQETSAARSREEASKHEAAESIIRADAELKTAQKHAEAKKIEAEGTIAAASAEGLAKVRVQEATAHAIELEGNAKASAAGAQFKVEAEGTRAKGAAEAESIAARADAMGKLNEVGRDHEEFKLTLARDERVSIARIQTQSEIAQANAPVMAEAMKGLKMNYIGGDLKAVQAVLNAATIGHTVDTVVNSSEVIKTLTNNGANPELLVSKFKELVDRAGITTDTLKNLSVSKLLNQLAANKSTSAEANELRSQVPDNIAGLSVPDALSLLLGGVKLGN